MSQRDNQSWKNQREVTKGGSEVIRHEHGTKSLNPDLSPFPKHLLPEKDMEQLSAHVEKHVGEIESVFHEVLSDDLHIDVNFVKPTQEFPMIFLSTMGMSAVPMKVPRGVDAPRFAELCLFLPPNWPISRKALEQFGEDAYWPIHWLKNLARLPYQFDTYLDVGHTIPNGDPPEPLSQRCKFVGFAIMPAMVPSLGSAKIGRREVTFFMLQPLFREEMKYKLDYGFDALLDRFDTLELNPLDAANPRRRNAAARE